VFRVEATIGTFAMVMTIFIPPCSWTIYLNIIGTVTRTSMLTLLSVSVSGALGDWLNAVRDAHCAVLNQLGNLMTVVLFFGSQLDSGNQKCLAEQQAQLRQGYTGHIRDSESSVPEDKLRILAEIRENNEEKDLDAAIDVMVRCGMVTRSLTAAHEKGIDVSGIGEVKWKHVSASLAGWLWCLAYNITLFKAGRSKTVIVLVSFLIWLIVFLVRFHRRDLRALAAVAGWKFVGFPLLLADVVDTLAVLLNVFDDFIAYKFTCYCITPYMCCVAVCIACSRLDVLAAIPVIGIPLAQFSVTDDISFCCAVPLHDDLSSERASSGDVELSAKQTLQSQVSREH